MDANTQNRRLCSITTSWSVVRDAHLAGEEVAREAQRQLLAHYGGAIRRYLLACVHDSDRADELFQEFGLRLVSGDFRKVDSQRGRFRDYVKTVLANMIAREGARRGKQPRQLASGDPGPTVPPQTPAEHEALLVSSWREELLARCWSQLEAAERKDGRPCYRVLLFQAQNPGLRSADLAAGLGASLGRPLTAPAFRQLLHRAREAFADLLVEEVAHALSDPTDEALVEELIELGLFEHCRPALERRDRRA